MSIWIKFAIAMSKQPIDCLWVIGTLKANFTILIKKVTNFVATGLGMRTSLGLTLFIGIALSIFASAILLYISIATMIGPWIAPTLVLIASFALPLFRKHDIDASKQLVMISALASGGGIIAVGVGFSLPMLYFLAPKSFAALMITPQHFMMHVGGTVLLAGVFGIFIGKFFSKTLLQKNDLSFPISLIAYQIASAQSHIDDARNLFKGVSLTFILCILRDGVYLFKGVIAKHITLFSSTITGAITFSIWPTLWSIGFTTGLASTIPLLVGLIARYAVLYPINHHSAFLSFSLFAPLKEESFITAFCAGMIISDIVLAWLGNPIQVFRYVKSYFINIRSPRVSFLQAIRSIWQEGATLRVLMQSLNRVEPVLGLCSFFFFFTYLKFSFAAQLVILVAMLIALYEINRLCGKIGLLQIGRFSAFILIPVIVLFKINALQMTALTIFFNVAAAVSSDLVFDYKTAELGNTSRDSVHGLQWIGLLVSSITVAAVCYMLFTSLSLGSEELFAHRGRSKALLVQSLHFDYYIVSAGFLFGAILRRFKISPTMAFGGIIMPSQITLGFVFGGLLSKLAGNRRDALLPFCSGIFATETLWLLICLSLRFLTSAP